MLYVIDNVSMLVRDYHVDGLRLDAVHLIADQSPLHILEELSAATKAVGAQLHRSTFVIAESNLNDPRLVRARDAGGYGLDAAWGDDWHHSVRAALTGERARFYADVEPLAQGGKASRQGS